MPVEGTPDNATKSSSPRPRAISPKKGALAINLNVDGERINRWVKRPKGDNE